MIGFLVKRAFPDFVAVSDASAKPSEPLLETPNPSNFDFCPFQGSRKAGAFLMQLR
jgi:hypothetical protein